MKYISVIGVGPGSLDALTIEARKKIISAKVIIGAKRLLDGLPDEWIQDKELHALTDAKEIRMAIEGLDESAANIFSVVVLFSGDVGFYSGAGRLLECLLNVEGTDVTVIPGISSMGYFFSKIQMPYEDVALHSAHGREVDVLSDVGNGRQNFYLTGGKIHVCDIAKELTDAGLGGTTMWIGSHLSYADEEILQTTAVETVSWKSGTGDLQSIENGNTAKETLKGQDVKNENNMELAVVLVDEVPTFPQHLPGLPDDAFLRERDENDRLIPMTKQIIRREAICELDPTKQDVVWDLGAGTGSVSVELSHFARQVYAIEKNPAAVKLIEKNRKRFSCWNMKIIEGEAPSACADLPTPDLIFIGGSDGNLREIFDVLPRENTTVVLTAVTLATLHDGCDLFEEYGYSYVVRQIQVNDCKMQSGHQMLLANNPVFILTGKN